MRPHFCTYNRIMADPHAERRRVRREECSCHSSRLVLFLLLHHLCHEILHLFCGTVTVKRNRQTSPRIKGRHPKVSCCSPRWQSFIYEAYSILPGHLRDAAFQPMLHQFRSAAARFAEPTANIDNVVNVLSDFIVWVSTKRTSPRAVVAPGAPSSRHCTRLKKTASRGMR